MIRHISAVDITEAVSKLLRQACCELDETSRRSEKCLPG